MEINLVQEELIKRYLYIYEHRDLILALCINNGIEKEFYKNQLKSNKELIKKIKKQKVKSTNNDEMLSLLIYLSSDCKKNMHQEKPYLFAKVCDDIVDAYEEFLFTDENMENTVLYKHIESLKSNPIFLEVFQESIERLEERRQKNQWLKKIPTFTVWKILTYVKNNNLNNAVVLEALEKYYNLDRYILTGVNWESGYKLLPIDYETKEEELNRFSCSTIIGESSFGGQYNAIILDYPGNEFEKEDNYFAFDWSMEFEHQPLDNYSKTNFMTELATMPMLPEELKSDLYQRIKYSFKNNCKKLKI